VQLKSTNKSEKSSWMIGMVTDEDSKALSFCYGTTESKKCALRIDASGTVQFLGASYFHGRVGYDRTLQEKPVELLGEGIGVKLDALGKARTTKISEGEIDEPINDVSWGGESEVLLDVDSGADKSAATYHTQISGGANWNAVDGNSGVRLESQNAIARDDVYLEMRNSNAEVAWGIGTQKDNNFHVGYGLLGSFASKSDYITVASANKDVSFRTNVVFSKQPSYFAPGQGLTLTDFKTETASAPKTDTTIKKEDAEVPETPIVSEDSFGSNSGAQPIAAYTSNKGDVSIAVSASSKDVLKEAFVEFRTQEADYWRLAVHPDGDLYLTYSDPSAIHSQSAEARVMKIAKSGEVHMYGSAYFGGSTMKVF